MNSAVYRGVLRHRRFSPLSHAFSYPLYMLAIDLDELSELSALSPWLKVGGIGPLNFRREDYLPGTTGNLKTAVQNKFCELSGHNAEELDRVVMVCQLRCFGVYFSPINVYFCYTRNAACYMLAEVSNTPWKERHYYLVDVMQPKDTEKAFHVSPFMSMAMRYRWDIEPPGKRLRVHIENWDEHKLFDASLLLRREPLTKRTLRRLILAKPLMTLSIMRGIYWQALRMFAKRFPIYLHPERS